MTERIEIGEVSVLKKVNDVIMAIIKVVLIVFGTVMTCLVIMNVILRYVFNSGLSWSEEASRFLFIWVTFLIVLVMLGTLFVGGVNVVKGTWPMLTSALEIPKGAVYLCAPIGFGYMFIQTLVKMVRVLKATDAELDNEKEEAE